MLGVNFFGDLTGNGSLSELARTTLLTLQRRGLPVTYTELLYPAGLYHTEPMPDPLLANLPIGSHYPVNVVCYNLHMFETLSPERLRELMQGKYTITNWVWEMPEVPTAWFPLFERVHEIWSPSTFVQRIFAAVTDRPVLAVPHPIEVPLTPNITRRDFGIPENRMIFLCIFSAASGDGRKNPWGVIEAFKRAFGSTQAQDAPLLIFKTQHSRDYPELMAALQAKVAEVGGLLIPNTYNRQQMNNLMSVIDCFVSLHRSEGFGLGLAEAMCVGKPVIATAYSGNVDFMDTENGYLVPYKLRNVLPEDHRYRPELLDYYTVEMTWAEPDIEAAAHWLRHVYENPAEAKAKGIKAAERIHRDFSPAAVGQLMYERIAAQSSLS